MCYEPIKIIIDNYFINLYQFSDKIFALLFAMSKGFIIFI
jgi:hypothetical protein